MSIQEQVEVLNRIVQIMHDSAGCQYEEMQCEFDHEVYDGGWSVGSKYSFTLNGSSASELLHDPDDEVPKLVHQLHDLMKAHTGGDWTRCFLMVDASGKATTKFTYL